MVYAATNAGPNEANGQVAVRWKVPAAGTYRAILWKQTARVTSRIFGAADFERLPKTKVTEFTFVVTV